MTHVIQICNCRSSTIETKKGLGDWRLTETDDGWCLECSHHAYSMRVSDEDYENILKKGKLPRKWSVAYLDSHCGINRRDEDDE